ncbi:MAG: hypothetical protein HXX19_04685, partial [Rhodoferax sp.]|nr:hypothetical protein [Rhodoferax sp.]
MLDKQRFVEKTRWLRPYTQWATRFALGAPAWLPKAISHAPLRLSQRVLRFYVKRM